MNKSPWHKLSSRYLLENPWYKVRQDKVMKPDGNEGIYNVIETPESVFIIPVTTDGKILFLKLFRYPTQREGWEIPAGGVEKGESLEEAARRELQEETGYTSDSWKYLGSFDSMNGITDAVGHVFVASDLTLTDTNAQEEEGITELKAIDREEIKKHIQSGDICDGLTLAALTKLFVDRI